MGSFSCKSSGIPLHNLSHHCQFISFVGLTIFMLLFCGCATSQRRESIPEVKQPDQSVKIYFVREKAFVGSAINYELMFDSINFFSISVGKYTMIKVDPGKHLVGVRWLGGMTLTWKENRKEYDFKSNQSYYFLVKNVTTFSDSVAVIEPISEYKWKEVVKESTYVAY
jgi:hypothetical protein